MTRRPSADDPGTSADAFTTPASLASPADSGMEDVAEAGVGDTSAVRTINRGAFSTVTLVLDRVSGRYCALKATRKADLLRVGAALSVVREKQALLALQPHPFVVQPDGDTWHAQLHVVRTDGLTIPLSDARQCICAASWLETYGSLARMLPG